MPKKHRVKRQNYVAHLRSLEKQREKYLEKRRAPKRSREADNEEVMNEVRDRMEIVPAKKRRTEADASTVPKSINEEGAAPHTRPAPMPTTKSAAAVKTAFFPTKPFADVVKASAAAAEAFDAAPPDAPATATIARKTLKRRYY
ncbi:hypothetical protein JIQ42_02365 [Leishmania sp. Namibia]|uniref:hypothetical protein n=1 Tax=Leishmania sp. Namibia TaxID=2802991 RepID=UPI001B538671|nr:hypothetical protein JIQ42_02365 [Leishmania sp. Namibia]